MKQPDKSPIEKLYEQGMQCTHARSVRTISDVLSLQHIWPEIAGSSGEILIEGAWVKVCQDCGQIVEYDKTLDSFRYHILPIKALFDQYSMSLRVNVRSENRIISNATHETTLEETAVYEAIVPRFNLDTDVILTPQTKIDIDNALTKLQHWQTIYEGWGFAKVDPMGKGAILNFYGPPGTGKTRTAEALAGKLGVKFINVNYGELTSRFMGQTSKNIRLSFLAAREQNALLFFDEADNVLSKRASSITSGVDAESNISKSTMLKELEQFDGICVFATNFPQVYDHAIVRRMGFDIKFELPDEATRRQIWEMHLVEGIPLAGDRSEIIDTISAYSVDCAGGDILKAMRMALPMALSPENVKVALSVEHLKIAVDKVIAANQANKEGGQQADRLLLIKNMFGL